VKESKERERERDRDRERERERERGREQVYSQLLAGGGMSSRTSCISWGVSDQEEREEEGGEPEKRRIRDHLSFPQTPAPKSCKRSREVKPQIWPPISNRESQREREREREREHKPYRSKLGGLRLQRPDVLLPNEQPSSFLSPLCNIPTAHCCDFTFHKGIVPILLCRVIHTRGFP